MLAVFLVLGVGSVYASTGEADLGLPILGTAGAPALAAPSLYSGAISVLYADGTSVVLESTQNIPLDVCNGPAGPGPGVAPGPSCVTVMATLKETSAGVYTYSFTPPTSLSGTITIYVPANALADDNGRIFPAVSTSIGTYVYAPSSSSSSSSAPPAASVPPAAGSPVQAGLTRQAVSTTPTPTQPTQASPIEPLLLVLSVLSVAGAVLAASKRRAH